MRRVLVDVLINTQSVLEILRRSAESLRQDRVSVDNAAGIERTVSFVRYATGIKAEGGVEARVRRDTARKHVRSASKNNTQHHQVKLP
jgi:hypothetical protein